MNKVDAQLRVPTFSVPAVSIPVTFDRNTVEDRIVKVEDNGRAIISYFLNYQTPLAESNTLIESFGLYS